MSASKLAGPVFIDPVGFALAKGALENVGCSLLENGCVIRRSNNRIIAYVEDIRLAPVSKVDQPGNSAVFSMELRMFEPIHVSYGHFETEAAKGKLNDRKGSSMKSIQLETLDNWDLLSDEAKAKMEQEWLVEPMADKTPGSAS